MLRFLINFFMILVVGGESWAHAPSKIKIEFVKPINQLFNHKGHSEAFGKAAISCADCHNFSVKSIDSDPLGAGVGEGFIAPSLKTCHQCHLGTVSMPRPNQCVLCHQNLQQLMPASHDRNWKNRHGKFAGVDSDSCKECHTDRSCTACHTQRDTLKPLVHRPNFRLTHSVEARANPEGCVVCHSTTTSCVQCHSKGLQ